ncbi:hypothetical protein [Mesorhizobium sp. INR15]|uniref:hypothetical protein n=1 Tax=Mesorhizobium sp. INR15 TaxID=2654248 RepID=UPI0018969EE3|nr:hypothetical protein [Mesorhizobium sp. INR15]QPC94068.1 hypothetical protein GA829_27685 [Mesorhizobium sp. INR15]
MRLISTASLLLTVCVVAGCSSLGGRVDPAKYDQMTCPELNTALGDVSRDISQTAVTRGKVAQTSIPNWLLGGSRVATAVASRETVRIDRLQQQAEAIRTARNRGCATAK